MPINQECLNYYSVDYENLWNYFNSIPLIFNSSSTQKHFLSQWIMLLQKCDKQNSAIFKSSQNLSAFKQRRANEPEIFQQELTIGDNTFYLHYRITYFKSLIKQIPNSEATLVDISEYASKPPLIHWSYPKDFDLIYPLDNTPVIAVEFPLQMAAYLIVDGNHRIAKHIIENSPFVPTFFINFQQVNSYKLLSMSFDLALYLFQNDICLLSSKKAEFNLSDSQLYSMSLLHMT